MVNMKLIHMKKYEEDYLWWYEEADPRSDHKESRRQVVDIPDERGLMSY